MFFTPTATLIRKGGSKALADMIVIVIACGGDLTIRQIPKKLRQLFKNIFPPAKTIQSRYTYLQENPWLLPAAWVHRLVKTSGDTKKHLESARQIIQADSEEVNRLKKLTKDIGL